MVLAAPTFSGSTLADPDSPIFGLSGSNLAVPDSQIFGFSGSTLTVPTPPSNFRIQ